MLCFRQKKDTGRFAEVAKYIQAAGRPLTSFCACELRSPAAFTEDGFRIFNEHYVKTLAQWGLFDHARMEREISELLGRKTELVSRRAIEASHNALRRSAILGSAQPIYVAR